MKTTILLIAFLLLFFPVTSSAQWQQTNCPNNAWIRALAVSPNGSSGTNLFAGTQGGGVFLSTDNGTSWTAVNNGLTNTSVYALAVSPSGSGGTNLFAGTQGGGVFLSNDNGSNWTVVNTGLTNKNVQTLAVNGANLFAGTQGGGIFLSTNNGTSWTAVNPGLTYKYILSFAMSPNGANLFAGTGRGVFLSTDNGTSWTAVNSGLTFNEINALAASSNGSGGTNLFAGTSYGGVFLSTDNGTSWNAVNSGLTYQYVYSFAVSPNGIGGTNLFAGTYGGGVFLSTDNGTSWSEVNLGFAEGNSGLVQTYIMSLTVNGTNLFAGTQAGLWRRALHDMINHPPVANAGANQTVNIGTQVTLNGSASSDPDGDVLMYTWKEGTTVLGTGAQLAVTLPVGVHTITLTVDDNRGGTNSGTVVITIVQPNRPPVANAGADQTVNVGTQVMLSASATDPDGDVLTYIWKEGTTVLGTSAQLPVTTLPIGVDTITLTVSDNRGGISSDTVVVTVVQPNRSPVANAGADQTVNVGTQVTLNGSASSDPDGDVLTYTWKKGATVLGTVAQLVVTTLPVGIDTITLTVNDNRGGTNSDTVIVTVVQPNRPPVANAGADQTVNIGTQVTLNGSASSDPDGDVLTYTWKKGTSVLGTGVQLAVTLPAGVNTITLTVNDNRGGTNSDTVIVTVGKLNHPPIANAGADQTVDVGTQVTLDGSVSSDPDGNALTYTWKEGMTVVGKNVKIKLFLPIGLHTIILTVDDNKGGTDSDTVVIIVMKPNCPPIAKAGPNQTINVGTQVMLDGSASTDPDGDSLTYTWNERKTTLGTGAQLTIALPIGVHKITLTVDDGRGGTSSDVVVITVVKPNSPPVANAGPDQTVKVTKCTIAKVMLDGSASFDPDGDELDFKWTEGTKTIGHMVKPQVTLSVGIHNIILTVEDEKEAENSDTVIVNVVDMTSPIIVVPSKPMVLWPPDHKYVTLNISKIVISATDKDGHSIRGDCVSIQSVSCDEPVNALGDGNTLNDIVISNDAKSVNLRAERQGGGNGRVYTINLVVRDASGNIGQASYEVWVPQSQNDKIVIDDGPAYTVKANSSLSKQGSELTKQGSELSLLNSEQPDEFKLYNNYPNPFNPSTEIKFGLVEESFVTLTVYDMLGRTVATLVRDQLPPGNYTATFKANGLSSGIYIYRLNTGTLVETKRMVLMK